MKSIEDFKNAVTAKSIRKWNIHDCSICGYKCGFTFPNDGNVYYDSGCGCVWYPPRPSSWEEVAESYNIQTSEEYIKEMNEFWGFEDTPTQGGDN